MYTCTQNVQLASTIECSLPAVCPPLLYNGAVVWMFSVASHIFCHDDDATTLTFADDIPHFHGPGERYDSSGNVCSRACWL